MIARVFIGIGLLLLGYCVGKEVGRMEPIREELRKAREKKEEETSTQQKSTVDE